MTLQINLTGIPTELRERQQWVLWKLITRDGKATKVPFQPTGQPAKSNDPATWSDFETVAEHLDGFEGPGFEFSADDPYVGIDLDGCRDPQTGTIAGWAKEIILTLKSYAEVSPSETGVKIWVRGTWTGHGRKLEIEGAERVCGKTPAIEVYGRGRYFAVTGVRLKCMSEIADRQAELNSLRERFWKTPAPSASEPRRDFRDPKSVFERARAYIQKLPPAISGQSGHSATFHAACVLCCGFGLDESDAMELMREYNQTCEPQWSERELQHKVQSALKQPGDRNYLRNVEPKNFDRVSVPQYRAHEPNREIKFLRTDEQVLAAIDKIAEGGVPLISTGIDELDRALEGGIAPSEMWIVGGLPGHGKTALVGQALDRHTGDGRPTLFICRDMPTSVFCQRNIQLISTVPRPHWQERIVQLRQDAEAHYFGRAPGLIIDNLRHADDIAEAIRLAAKEHGVQFVAIDYLQLLEGKGRDQYEKTSSASRAIRDVTTETKVVAMALCQMNREFAGRSPAIPRLSDLRGSGTLEADADVITFVVRPHLLDTDQDPGLLQIFTCKNRSRATLKHVVHCRFLPERMRIVDQVESREPDLSKGWL